MRFAVDVQLLMYAHHADYPQHEKARDWLTAGLSQTDGFALPWQCLLSYVRLSVKQGLLHSPITVAEAWADVQALLDTRRIWLADPTARHREVIAHLLPLLHDRGDDVSDAHIAAICLEHHLTLCTADRGFARFEPAGLRWTNPLI